MTRLLRLAAVIALVPLAASGQEYDLVLRGGRLIDGTGAAAHAGDVAVRDGRIAAVGTFAGRGKTELMVEGRVVAPGFIDVHTHAEDVAELPAAENFIRMGVTTIVTGNCGGSKLDVAAFFAEIERTGVSLNVATLIGHNTVRGQVMGGSFRRPPTKEELAAMCGLVERAMKAGAVGLSTGLIYLPGTFSKTDEIVELAKVAAAHGGIYASHMRHENAQIVSALEEVAAVARGAHIRAEISHIKLGGGPVAWGRADEIIAWLERARASGLDLTQDQYVYTASQTGISSRIPDEALEGGAQLFRQRIGDPARKARFVDDMKSTLKKNQQPDYGFAVISDFPPDRRLNGKSIPQAAKFVRGSDSIDDQIELILDLEARGGADAVFHGVDENDLQKFLVQPLTMIASDSGVRRFRHGVPHPRGYGNNARVLGHYVRELKLLSLEDAVRKMTSLPAQIFKLKNRGELRTGFVADLVIFDPETVGSAATFDDPHHYATGFSDVIVNGTPVIRAGEFMAARPGRPVRLNE
ncbi:MAG: D-aminoacylase [Opitutaceae bacterium]|nr:D-aminoacylase [Opitutaceae bacterium]